ncbi:hypothetical protein E2562_012515 [Oryza meyeriana var. granulata]|uniref:Uncharacterized protein n=1 Tax=Oryza meyeriana var. granulata TaxID=110450 RepID=A0A6G1BWM4_9ORYZ|nr:hypothetical protein E2562_012515 [Oryza meyeriana var. granulata]
MEQDQAVNHSAVLEMSSLAQQYYERLRVINASPAAHRQTHAGEPSCVLIGRVVDMTRSQDEQEYDPHYVSIGPYHYRKDSPLAREDDKLQHVEYVLAGGDATANTLRPDDYQRYLTALEQMDSRVRSCYTGRFPDMTVEELAGMMLLDGCYILARFGHLGESTASSTEDTPAISASAEEAVVAASNGALPVENESASTSVASESRRRGDKQLVDVAMVRDVWYLEENQIPFFVVEEIHRLSTGGTTSGAERIARYARELLRPQLYSTAPPPQLEPPPGNLLHLLHMHMTSTTPRRDDGDGGRVARQRWRTVTEYSTAGVAFRPRDLAANPGCLLDVKLTNGGGTLEVPRLNADGETLRLLRNLTALEQHNAHAVGSRVTAYCMFLSQVACTAGDVTLLSKVGILSHLMGNDKEVAGYFADLCKGIVFDVDDPECNYLRSTCRALEQRYQSRPRRWMAWLKQKHFRNPWVTVAVVAASLTLVCGLVQAVFAILSYKNAKN